MNEDGASGPGERILSVDRTQIDETGSPTLRGVRYATIEWGDADNDGDLDLLVLGMEENGTSLTRLYTNTSGLLEQDQVNSENLVSVHNGDADWGDYDNDGDLDLILSGNNVTTSGGLGSVTEFYKNEPVGSLTLDATVNVSTPSKVARLHGETMTATETPILLYRVGTILGTPFSRSIETGPRAYSTSTSRFRCQPLGALLGVSRGSITTMTVIWIWRRRASQSCPCIRRSCFATMKAR